MMIRGIKRSPDEPAGGGAPAAPAPAPAAPEPKPREQLEGELARRREREARLEAELTDLRRFREEQQAATERQRQADLEARGEFAKLKDELAGKLTAAEAKLAAFEQAEAARRDAKKAEVREMLTGRTDAEELAGKAARIVGDDPYRQAEFLREIIAADKRAAPTGGPPRPGSASAGGGEPGRADLTPDEIAACESTAEMLGMTVDERIKKFASHKRAHGKAVA